MHRKAVALAGLLSAALFSQHAAAQGLFWGNSYEARQPQYAAYGGQAGYGAYAAPQYGAYGAQAHYGSPNQVYDEEYRAQASPIPRQLVSFDAGYAPGTIVISTDERRLYYVLGHGKAIQYGVGVGRPGFEWSGTKTVSAEARMAGLAPAGRDAAPPPGPAALHARAAPTTRSAPAPCISAARSTASTARTSPRRSARRSPRAASA